MKIDNKKICLFMMFLLLVVCTMIFNKSSIEGHEDLHYDPNDADENNWLHQTFNIESLNIDNAASEEQATVFWTGFNDVNNEGIWTWTSGEEVFYTNWSS